MDNFLKYTVTFWYQFSVNFTNIKKKIHTSGPCAHIVTIFVYYVLILSFLIKKGKKLTQLFSFIVDDFRSINHNQNHNKSLGFRTTTHTSTVKNLQMFFFKIS